MRYALSAHRRALALLLAALAGVTMLVVGPAPPASAAPNPLDIQFVQGEATGGNNPSAAVTATVACPDGKRVVSSSAIATSGKILATYSDEDFTEVTAMAHNTGGFQTVHVLAGCVPAAQLTDAVVSEMPVSGPTTAVRTGIAPCADGRRAFAGGGFFRNVNGTVVPGISMVQNAPATTSDGWAFSGRPLLSSDTLVVRTLCARIPGSFVQVQHGSGNGFPDAFQVFCPSTHRVLSGGAYMQRPSDGGVANGNIGTNWHLSLNRWAVAGTPFGPIGNRLVGFALCVPV